MPVVLYVPEIARVRQGEYRGRRRDQPAGDRVVVRQLDGPLSQHHAGSD